MSEPQIFTNARIVLEDKVVEGTLRTIDGKIDTIEESSPGPRSAVDFQGDFLLPGLIDVHTDHLEKHAMPRTGVFWPPISAVIAYDAVIISAGITTVFDSLCLGSAGKAFRKRLLPQLIDGLAKARREDALKADHRLHLRCDLLDPDLEDQLETYMDTPHLQFITFLDDSAGRHSLDYYYRVQRERGASDEAAIQAKARQSLAEDGLRASRNRRLVADLARARGIVSANHDDSRTEHITEAVSLGMTVLEFAITDEAAKAAKAQKMTVIAGGPNVVNGGSHFGNVAAADLVLDGTASILCSDYVPASLLQAAFRLHTSYGLSLPSAVATVSAEPARVFGLADRGTLSPGRRADFIRVAQIDGTPSVRGVWTEGRLRF